MVTSSNLHSHHVRRHEMFTVREIEVKPYFLAYAIN